MPRKKKRTRRRKTWSILNGLEALTYAQILSVGTTGGGVWDFFTGGGDIGYQSARGNIGAGQLDSGATGMQLVGTDVISLADLMKNPTLSLDQLAGNFQANIIPMAIAGFTTSIAFRVGRRLLRKPLSMITKDIIKPVLGSGVRM